MAKKKTEGTVAKVAGAAKEAAVKAAAVTAQAAKATVGAVQNYVVEPVEKALGVGKAKPKAKPKPAKSAAATKAAKRSLTKSVAKTIAKPGAKTPANQGPGPTVARRNWNDTRAAQTKRPK
jgi:hypothetical protein